MNRVLDEVPRDMERLYQRILHAMSQAARGKELAKGVLTWITCAMRPLTLSELNGALEIDLKDNFPGLKECIIAACGQLVTIDKFSKVQLVHETIREFL